MILGDTNKFAIQYELDENHGGEWLYGKMCYWIGGKIIGDYEQGTSLRDVLFQSKYIIYYRKNRKGTIKNFDPDFIYQVVNSLLLEELVDTSPHNLDIIEPVRYDITIRVDIFNGFNIFLIDEDNQSEVIYKSSADKSAFSMSLDYGFFDSIFDQFYDNLNSLYECERQSKLRSPEN